MCFWMFDCNQCVLERLFQKTACLVWKFGCGSAHALVSQPQMGRRGACLHLPQECMTYMNMVGGGGNCRVVHYCYRPPLFDARWGWCKQENREVLVERKLCCRRNNQFWRNTERPAVDKRGMESFNKRNWKTVLFRGMIWVCITPKLSPVDWR